MNVAVERTPEELVRSTRTTIGTGACFLVGVALALVIGAVGPVAIKKHNSTHSTHRHKVIAAAVDYPVFSGSLTAMVPAHQMLWLDCLVKRPEAFGSKGDKTFQLAFRVSAEGETQKGKMHALASERYDYHTVRCKGGETWCKAVPLFAQHAILYDSYHVKADVVHPFGLYPGSGYEAQVDGGLGGLVETDVTLTTKMELHFVNREYTSFELGFYAVYLVVSVFAVVAPQVGYYARLRGGGNTLEQGWCLALLVAHAVGFVNPLYALEVGARSKQASTALSCLFLYSCFVFLGLGLCYALLFASCLGETVRERRVFSLKWSLFAAVLSTTWGCLGATVALYTRFEGSGDPQYDDPGHHHVYGATRAALAVSTAVYCVAFVAALAGGGAKVLQAPPHDVLSILLLAVFVLVAFLGAFLGGFDSVHTKPLPFAAFVSVPTLAVWALAFLNAKPATRKADAAGGVPEASENDMNAML